MLLPCACGNKWVIAQQLIGPQDLITEIKQAALVEDPAVGAQRGAQLLMFDCEQVDRVCIRAEAALQLKVGRCRCGTACLDCAGFKLCCELLNLVGAKRLVFGTREVAGDVAEESRWIPKRQEALETKFKEMFAE